MMDGRCVCALIPSITLSTHLSLIFHYREIHKRTNTGHFALKALTRSAGFVWGGEDAEDIPADQVVPPGYQGYVLAPGGEPVTPELATKLLSGPPLALVATDGNWRQATKMCRRVPAIKNLPQLALVGGPPSEYHLREETKENGLATYEAIARLLGALHGKEVEQELLKPFHALVRGTMDARGRPLDD